MTSASLNIAPPGNSGRAVLRIIARPVRWPDLRAKADRAGLRLRWDALTEGGVLLVAATENPVMHRHAKALIRGYRPPAQSVQPWQFGIEPGGPDDQKKRTCLWLDGLMPLRPTGTLDGSTARDDVHKASPGPDRAARRSRFFPGLAAAMALQWGGPVARAA